MAILEDFPVNIRIKLAALWTSVMFCYLYGDYFELYVPQKVEGLLTGQNILNTPTKLLAACIMLAAPALMIALSVLLKPASTRLLNLLLGLFFTGLMLVIAATSWSEWRMFYVLLALVESSLTATIVWLAWHWPSAKERVGA